MSKIVISANSAWFLLNFRATLIRALIERGYEVVAAAHPDPASEEKLRALGCTFRPVTIDSKGLSPLRDGATFRQYVALLRSERPACYLSSTIKPNIFGGYAARIVGVPFIGDVTGLGTAFMSKNWLSRAVTALYRIAFARACTIFFHNAEDRDLFLRLRMVSERQAQMIPGAGVDVDRFAPQARSGEPGTAFLLVARMLRDKGVYEYVEAARQVRGQRPGTRFRMLGFVDVENRTAIPRAVIEEWHARGDIEFLGTPPDVRPHIAAADCIVLPSYREGTAVSLLEAAAMARPLIASDVPGCREVIDEGVTGFLCKVRDPGSLATALKKIVDMDPVERASMGEAGRDKILREYDSKFVIERYLAQIDRCLHATR